jgi:squalene synthase HpnD/squalene synthase HpnC
MTVDAIPGREKTYRTENFPVASRLLEAQYRAPIMAFYQFVRTVDEVADHPGLPPTEKFARLDQLEAELTGHDGGTRRSGLRDILIEHDLDVRHAREMLVAFRSDVTHKRYRHWEDLVSYCRYSAVPVGRFVLDVVGESRSLWPASDALCTALQVINHLQDCGDDYRRLRRVYIPLEMLETRNAKVDHLALTAAGPALRLCLDDMCDRISELLAQSSTLCAQVQNVRLGLEIAVIHRLAVRLTRMLRAHDPLCEDVRLSALGSAGFAFLGALWGSTARIVGGGGMAVAGSPARRLLTEHRPAAVNGSPGKTASGSTFYSAMRVLPEDKRNAIFEVYGFCRAVDDIADCQGDRAARGRELDGWRRRIDSIFEGRPRPECSGLAKAVSGFGLRRRDFMDVIDGMEMDVREDICAPDAETLDLYCDRVAGAVGRLCVRIFGMDERDGAGLAHHLGRALQLTNILRDLDEDARIGRLYLPREALEAAGISAGRPLDVIAHPALDAACRQVADLALARYADADAIMARSPRSVVRAPRVMSVAYRTLLDQMVARGWRAPRQPVHLSRLRLAGVALRSLVL